MSDAGPNLPQGATSWWNDAAVYGDLDACADVLDREIVIGITSHGKRTKSWPCHGFTVGQLVATATTHKAGQKDGQAILQGELVGVDRKADAVTKCHLMMLDCDSGDDMDSVRDRIQQLGLFAVIWTTHSHGATQTEIVRDRLTKKDAADIEGAKAYLRREKGYTDAVLAGATCVAENKHLEAGPSFIVGHAPLQKFRILLVLSEPFDFSEGDSHRARKKEWENKLEEVSAWFGVRFDRSCVDPSRLMYMPSHPPGAEFYAVDVVAGESLDLNKVPGNRLLAFAKNDRAFDVGSNEFKTPWLRVWLAKNAEVFLVEDFFHAHGEYRGAASDGGQCFKCPNDGAHSNAGNSADSGFYCLNPGSGHTATKFVAKCKHNSCSDLDGWRLLDLVVSDLGLSEADLVKFCDEGLRPEEPPPEPGSYVAEAEAMKKKREAEGAVDYVSAAVYEEAHIKKAMQALNDEWAMVALGTNLRIIQIPKVIGDTPEFRSTEAWRGLLANKKINVPGGEEGQFKAVPASKLWNEWPGRKTFDRGVIFAPGVTDAKKIPGKYNLWTGWPVPADPKASCDLFDAHLLDNVCQGEQEKYDFLLMFCADIFQNPGDKKGSALVLRGLGGTGKSTLGEYMLAALGRYGVPLTSKKQVAGDFNAIQESKVLVVCEEAFFSGDHEANNALKNMITSKRIVIERKGIDAYETDNHARYIIISNEDAVVKAVLGERRYMVLDCGAAHRKDEEYFTALRDQMDNQGGLAAWVHKLLTYKPPEGRSWSWLRNPPMTEGLREQIELNMTPEDEWFINTIRTGKIAGFGSAGIEFDEDADTFVETGKLLSAWEMALNPQGHDRKRATGAHVRKLAQRYWVVRGDGRAGDGAERHRGFYVANLVECRAKLAAMGVDGFE